MKNIVRLFTAACLLIASGQYVSAAESPTTSVVVKKMHCTGCAKRIAAKLYEVRGVKEVKVDVAAKTLLVAGGENVSPRALWEAVEAAKDQPVRLAGPRGSFTEKPAN